MAKLEPDQRKALGAFLASKRARLRPSDIGLAESVRRTPGLRREEIALLSGVSVSWYTWIEQGRDIQVSAETLQRIGAVLKLDHVEIAHLLALASHKAPSAPTSVGISEGLTSLVKEMDPIPAYVRNTRFDVLAWNTSIIELFLVDYRALAPHERNTLHLMFLHKPYRALILNWDTLAHGYVSSFRAARTRAVDKKPFDELAAELSQRSPEFRAWWLEVDVELFSEGYKHLRHPSKGDVTYLHVTLVAESQPDLSVVVYLLTPNGESRS